MSATITIVRFIQFVTELESIRIKYISTKIQTPSDGFPIRTEL